MSRGESRVNQQLKEIKGVFENNQDLSYKLFNHLPIGVCITNDKGHFTDVNEAYLVLYGYSKQELVGESFLKVVPEQSQNELSDLHSRFMGRKYELSGRWVVWGKNKEKFEILSNAAYLDADEQTKEPRKMTFVVKVNELEDTILKLQETVQLLEDKLKAQSAAADMAEHQMRNRLGSIVTIADMLHKTEMNDMQRKWINLIKNAGQDTLEMLNTTRDFAAMERGNYSPNISNFDILDLFAQIQSEVDQLQEQYESKVVIHFEGKPLDYDDELTIDADRTYLKHLFKNLMSNAIEAAPTSSTITVDTVIPNDEHINITIHNPGVIPQKIRGSFFEKYSTHGKKEGTGLGTYIAQMIANLHDGNISFITHEQEGTTLFVNLPRNSSSQ